MKVFVSFLLWNLAWAQNDELQGKSDVQRTLTIKLYHSVDNLEKYSLRGTIVIPSQRENESFMKQDPLSSDEVAAIKRASLKNGNYYLKAVAYRNNGEDTRMATTFLKACSMYESGLSDIITVALDHNENFLGISAATINSYCVTSNNVIPSKLTHFNSSLNILHTVPGPIPDTQTYIQRMEQEKAEKLRGDKGDTRSFLAKYWIYIVPLVVLLMISGATNPDAQSGGNGGR